MTTPTPDDTAALVAEAREFARDYKIGFYHGSAVGIIDALVESLAAAHAALGDAP